MTTAEDREALAEALGHVINWETPYPWVFPSGQQIIDALLPVVDKIARRRAAEELRTAAVEEAITGTWPLRVYSNDLIARAEALKAE